MNLKTISITFATLAAAILATTPADAQVTSYIGAGGAAWETTTNWSLGAVPTSSNDVFVDSGNQVRINSAAVANNLTIGGTGAGIVQLRRNAAYSLTVGGSIVMAPGAGNATLQLGVSSGGSSTLTVAGGTGSIVDGGGAGATDIAVYGPVTVNLRSVAVDTLGINQDSSGSLTIGAGQLWTVTNNTLIGANFTDRTYDLTVSGTLNSTTVSIGNAVVNGTNSGTLNLETGGVILAQTLQRSNAMSTVFNWNGGTIQNKSGVDLTVQGSSTNTLTVSLAGTGTHSFNADSGRTITVASSAVLANKSGQNGTLDKSGAGTLILQGANTYTGATTLSAGTLRLSHQNAIQTSTLTMNGGSLAFDSSVGGNAFTAGGLSGTSSGAGFDIALQNNAGSPAAVTLTVGGNNASTTYAGVLSAAGGLTKSGNGVLTLTGANTFSGATTVSSGSLQIGGGGTTGAIGSTSGISVASGATLAFNRSDNYGGNFTRTITGSGGVVLSSGTLTLSGTLNTFSGGIAVNGGVLKSLGRSAGNTITVNNGGSLGMAGTDTWGGAPTTNTPAVTINAGGNMTTDGYFNSLRNLTLAGGTISLNGGLASTSSALVLGGTVTASGPVTSTIVVTSGSNNAIRLGRETVSEVTEFNVSDASGQLSVAADLWNNFGGSTAGLTKTGLGTMVLTGSNIYTNATIVSAGTLQLGNGGSAGSIGSTSSISVASGATLAFNRSDNYGGAFDRQITGSGAVTLSSGTLVLTNNDTYSGATTISAGTLQIGNGGTAGAIGSTSGVSVASGATLAFNRSDNYGGNFTRPISGSGTVAVNSGTLALDAAGNSGYSSNLGFVINNGASVVLSHSDMFGGTNWNATASPAFTINAGGVLSSNNSYNTLWNATLNGGTLRSNGGANTPAQAFALAGTLTVGGSTASLIESGTIGNGLTAVNISGSGNNTLTMNVADVTGNSSADLTITAGLQNNRSTLSNLTKTGIGTVVLSGSSSFTGATTIAAGVLQLGNGGAAGSIGSTSIVSVASGATLAFNRSDNYGGAFDRQITGSGAVTLSSGTLMLTNNDTYSGATTISAGTLQIGNGGTAGAIGSTSGVSVASGATLAFNRSDNYGGNFTRPISGSGTVAVNSGTLALDAAGNSSYSSNLGFVINNGASVVLNHDDMFGGTNWNATASPAFTINAGGVLSSNNSYNTLWNATLNGGTLRSNGGANAPAQAFALAGTLTVGGSTASLIESGTIGNGLTAVNISGSGNNTLTMNVADVTGNSNADLTITAGLQNNRLTLSNLTKTGIGTLVLSGSNSYTGVTTISAGRLLVNGTNAGTGGTTVAAGALLGGSGRINGLVTVSGTLSPGNSPGDLSVASLVLTSTATTLMEIDGPTAGTGYDQISILAGGSITYGGILQLNLSQTFADNTTFDLFEGFGSSFSGDFTSITSVGTAYTGLTFTRVNNLWTSGSAGSQTLEFNQATGQLVIVPEPGALALAGLGIAAAGWMIRRRRS